MPCTMRFSFHSLPFQLHGNRHKDAAIPKRLEETFSLRLDVILPGQSASVMARIPHQARALLIRCKGALVWRDRISRTSIIRPRARLKIRAPTITSIPQECCDLLMLSRYYQSLLDSRQFANRAVLARYLGVIRAMLTQVLNRLNTTPAASASSTLILRVLSRSNIMEDGWQQGGCHDQEVCGPSDSGRA